MDNKKFTPALGYDFLTIYYDFAIKLTMPEKKYRGLLIDELNPQNNETILEFGFGTGQNLILANAQNKNTKFIGVDIDQKVREIALHKSNQTKGLCRPTL